MYEPWTGPRVASIPPTSPAVRVGRWQKLVGWDERRQRAAAAGTEMALGSILAGAGLLVFLGASGLVGMIIGCTGLGRTSHGYLTRREMTGERTS